MKSFIVQKIKANSDLIVVVLGLPLLAFLHFTFFGFGYNYARPRCLEKDGVLYRVPVTYLDAKVYGICEHNDCRITSQIPFSEVENGTYRDLGHKCQ